MSGRGITASFLLSLFCKITNLEPTSQFKLVQDPDLNRVIDLLINKTITVRLYNSLLTFRDTDEKFEVQGDLLEMITKKIYNVDLANLADRKLMYEFAKKSILMKKL